MIDARRVPAICNADWLRAPATQQVFAALNQDGHSARTVGGCVRNSLFAQIADGSSGVEAITDIDFATTATPDETLKLAAAAGLRTVPTGLQHGTVTVIAGGEGFEVTTLRRDVATDGRRAEVAFTDDWAIDAARRDLTINALYADADGTIFDPLGGFEDLCNRRIRFVGDATIRIREDYLRILRFFRFFAQYGEGFPDAPGLAACVAERGGLAQLSAERVHQELMKLLVSPGATTTLQIMADYGLLGEILPVVPNLARLDRLISNDPLQDKALRLAALCIDIDEDVARVTKTLRLSRQEAAVMQLAASIQKTAGIEPLGDAAARHLLYRHGAEDYVRLIKLQRTLYPEAKPLREWERLAQLPVFWDAPTFPITGKDLIQLGLAPGVVIGDILNELESRWLQSDFLRDRQSLLTDARGLVADAKDSKIIE